MAVKPASSSTQLQLGNFTLPLKGATSFWLNDKKEGREITVYYDQENRSTAVGIIFNSTKKMHSCISHFLNHTNLKPNILTFRDVKPIVSEFSEPGEPSASIRFEFDNREDFDCFQTHYAPYISAYTAGLGCKHGMESIYKHGNVPHDYVKVNIYDDLDTPTKQIKQINTLIARIISKFGDSGIYAALQRNQDPNFTGRPVECMDFLVIADGNTFFKQVERGGHSSIVPATADEIMAKIDPDHHREMEI